MTARVFWEGPLFEHHSLASVNREIVLRLSQMPEMVVGVCTSPPASGFAWDPAGTRWLRSLERVGENDAAVTIRHQWPLNSRAPGAGRWVIMQPWEYGSIPAAWYAPMRYEADEVWVYSTFNRQCYVEAGIPEEKVRVVPLGFSPGLLQDPRPFPFRTNKRFRFLFVGGTILRKGIDLLLDAYRRAFTAADDVCLVIKDFGAGSFYRGQTYGSRIEALQKQPGAPEIEYITEDLAEDQLRDLYNGCDCLVHPFRGEGFGLPVLEAMACGLPVVVPDQGGAADFANVGTAITVPSRRVAVPSALARDLSTRGTAWWLEVDRSALTDRMREVYSNPQVFRDRALQGRDSVRSSFTWETSAAAAAGRIRALADPGGAAVRDDEAYQYGERMKDGVAAWEAGHSHEALRLFVEASQRQNTEDAQYNIAGALIARGDDRTAASVLSQLATRLRTVPTEEARSLLEEVEPTLEDIRQRVAQPVVQTGEPIRIKWEAPVFNASGYASESRAFLEGIVRDPAFDLHLRAHERKQENGGLMDDRLFSALVEKSAVRPGRPHVEFQHGPATAFTSPSAPLSICRTMFETDRIPLGWVEMCNRFTEVWVPSEFNRDTFARSGVVPQKIRIVPGAIDASRYAPSRFRGVRHPGTRSFAFLSVFDFTPRKGWEILIRAYCREFSADESVTLVVKVVNFFREGSPEAKVRDLLVREGITNPPHILLIDQEYSEEDLMRLYAGTEAFVLPSRGEGWGRPYMEAMAFGRPVIGTRWSANLEFMNDENSFLVEIEGLEPCERTWSMPLYEGHQWAIPSESSLRAQMRRVYEDRAEASLRAARARQDVEQKYDVPVVGRAFRSALHKLLSQEG